MDRGMNAAIAVHGDYAYIGSRTDGGHPGMPHGGIIVVDISDPAAPALLGPPLDAKPGESSRELRVWKSQDILIVLNTNCGVGDMLHHCTQPSISNFRFYDISGANARSPRLLHQFNADTHEFFLWQDPWNPDRALIFAGNAGSTCQIRGGSPSCPFSVWDISPVVRGEAPVTLFSGLHGYSTGALALAVGQQRRHARVLRAAGGRFRRRRRVRLRRRPPVAAASADHPRPGPADVAWPGAHSAIKFWNRDWAWVSDEVYGTATAPDHGCPWGWARIVRIDDPRRPRVLTDYRLPQNDPDACDRWEPRPRTSYSAHNPTLTPKIAFSTWHSGGFQAVSIRRPTRPVPAR